jgi:SAM-dependent methyltransferase
MEPIDRHPDRMRWNARYEEYAPSFAPHPLAVSALAMNLPAGPVLDLACGPSGSALAAAAAGRHVTAVDVADVALKLLADEAGSRGLAGLISLVQADLATWRPKPLRYAIVLGSGYWDPAVFAAAAAAVMPAGVLAWEAFTEAARLDRPQLPAQWCLRPGEPATLLAADFDVLIDIPKVRERGRVRQLLALRTAAESAG